MTKIKFENGIVVNFEGNPTPQDIEEVANKLGVNQSIQKPSMEMPKIKKSFGQKTLETSAAVGKFLGMEPLGRGLAMVGRKFTPEFRALEKRIKSGQASPQDRAEYASYMGEVPSAKQIIGSAIQTAGAVLPIGIPAVKGATAGIRIAKGAGIGAGVGAGLSFGKGLEEEKNITDIAKQTATGGVMGGMFGGASESLVELGKLLTSPKISEAAYNKALGLTRKEIEKGKSPAKRLISEGIWGGEGKILAKSQTIINQSEKEINSILLNNKTKIASSDVIDSIRQQLQNKFSNSLNVSEIDEVISKLPINRLKIQKNVSISQLNALRKEIDHNFLGSVKWLNDSTAERIMALKTAASTMRNIVKQTDAKLPSIFERYADAIMTKISLNRELAKPHLLSNVLELLGSGAVGSITGGGDIKESLTKGAMTWAAIKGVKSAAVRTLGGQIVKKAGEAGAKLAPLEKLSRMGGQQIIKELNK